jgi:hypothetical protein
MRRGEDDDEMLPVLGCSFDRSIGSISVLEDRYIDSMKHCQILLLVASCMGGAISSMHRAYLN